MKEPIKASSTNEVIRKIEFVDDLPVLHGNPAWGEMPAIVLTGNSTLDIANAQRAWRKLNPNMALPPATIFHHDLLRAKTMTMVINGKKTNVVVGVMQLVPVELHKALSHQGSASAARRVYDALDVDAKLVESFAMSSSALGGIDTQFKRLRVAKPLRKFVGRAVHRVVPIVGTAIGVLEFTQNHEAHGFVGALARATPVLSDLIGAYDLGSELAKEINDAANEKLDADMKEMNAKPVEAMILANQQAVEAFQELASEIEVTEYDEYRTTSELVDLDATADALRRYRDAMQSAYYLKLEDKSYTGFEDAAAAAKEELKNRLKGALRTHVQLTDAPTA